MSCSGQHAARGVLRRIQDDQLGAVGDQAANSLTSRRKSRSSRSGMGTGLPAHEIDHRLVDRETGIGVDDFIALIHQRQDGEENDRLTARNHDHFVAGYLDAARAADVFGDGLAQLGQARRWPVVRPAVVQSVARGFDRCSRACRNRARRSPGERSLALLFQGARTLPELQRRFPCPAATSGWQDAILAV